MQILYFGGTIRLIMLAPEAIKTYLENPIPVLKPSTGWKEIEIIECGEPLVPLNNLNPDLIVVDPQYLNQKIPHALSTTYLREGATNALIQASKSLPKGFKFVVWDAWRPLEVQQSLFDEFKHVLTIKNPDWNEDRLIKDTQTYVSLPSTNLSRPSPHNTGGAIDLSICNTQNIPLSMGVPFDFFGKESSTNFYENPQDSGTDQTTYRNNRRLLFNVMTRAGFTNYDEEYWHFDLGNQFDAIRRNSVAIYGAITPK